MVRVIQTLLTWYQEYHRKMPWRETSDPYKIWISEIILQQTRVQQGLPYYLRFIGKFHTVSDLALADESEVLKLWQGLGYYSRARNLHKAAKIIHQTFHGRFPENFDEIALLPGVGDYTASAIAAFAFNLKTVAVDGNVKRFAARWLGVDIPIEKQLFVQRIKHELLEVLGDSPDSNLFNQAIIELGATICTPTNPSCSRCPLQETCVAYSNNHQTILPVITKKLKPQPLNIVFFAIQQLDCWWVVQRDESSVWANLYEFPNREVNALEMDPVVLLDEITGNAVDSKSIKILGFKDFKHQLSHRSIQARCWHFSIEVEGDLPKSWVRLPSAAMGEIPVHRLMEKMMEYVRVWK